MKSDNHSKYTESNPRTILVTDDLNDNSPYQGNIKFKFSDNSTASYDLSTISSINPFFFSTMSNQNQVEILLPPYITPNLLMEFLFIVKNGFADLEDSPPDSCSKILSLIKISDFFQNENISSQIVSDVIIPRLNFDNSLEYLQFAYEKLIKITESNEECDPLYFDLFYKCLEILGKNVHLFIKQLNKIRLLDKKIIDELIQKCFSSLIFGNYILVEKESDTIDGHEIEGENYFDEETQTDQGSRSTNFISLKSLESLISFLYETNKCFNFFDLLTMEYMNIFSNETIKELENLPNPTFQIKIPYDFDNYYEEYSINFSINEKKIIFVLFYKKSDDTFNVCIKLGDTSNCYQENSSDTSRLEPERNLDNKYPGAEDKYCFKIFTFLSIVKINDDSNIRGISQTNVKSLSNNKSMHSIFKISNFKNLFKNKIVTTLSPHEGLCFPSLNKITIDNEGMLCMNQNNDSSLSIYSNDFFSITINLKLCFIHSALTSFFLKNFSSLSEDKNIFKISKQLLVLIIKNKYLSKKSEDDIVKALINWLNDEINIKEDISELFEVIKWEKVKDEYIFEFIMKYAHMISGEESEIIFLNAFEKKHQSKTVLPILISLIRAAHKVDYNSVFTLMKKNEKFNQIYMSSSNKFYSVEGSNNGIEKNIMNEHNNHNISNTLFIKDSSSEIEERKKISKKGSSEYRYEINKQNDEKSSTSKYSNQKKKNMDHPKKVPMASPLINFLLRHDLEEGEGKPVSRNQKGSSKPLNIPFQPKKMSHINNTSSPNYHSHLNTQTSCNNEGFRKHTFFSNGANTRNKKIQKSTKQNHTKIMSYIKQSKQMNHNSSNKNINRNKSLTSFSPSLSFVHVSNKKKSIK